MHGLDLVTGLPIRRSRIDYTDLDSGFNAFTDPIPLYLVELHSDCTLIFLTTHVLFAFPSETVFLLRAKLRTLQISHFESVPVF